MTQITPFPSAIEKQLFEQVGLNVGRILAAEISSQATLKNNPLLNAVVWNERFTPFDNSEMPAVNVSFAGYDNVEYNPVTDMNKCLYNIDVFTSGDASLNNDSEIVTGDLDSRTINKEIVGIIRAVLRSSKYKLLEVPKGRIRTHNIEKVMVSHEYYSDTNFLTMTRISLSVILYEDNVLDSTRTLNGNTTNVKISSTNKGYFFELNM